MQREILGTRLAMYSAPHQETVATPHHSVKQNLGSISACNYTCYHDCINMYSHVFSVSGSGTNLGSGSHHECDRRSASTEDQSGEADQWPHSQQTGRQLHWQHAEHDPAPLCRHGSHSWIMFHYGSHEPFTDAPPIVAIHDTSTCIYMLRECMLMRDTERSKQCHTNNKGKQHNKPKAVTFQKKTALV